MLKLRAYKVALFICGALIIIPLACDSNTKAKPDPISTTPVQESEVRVNPKQYSAPPEMVIDPSKMYTATFEMEKGEHFIIELYASEVPETVNNFVFLAKDGYYDGITFHRVIAGFMAQTGDPTGTGGGGPGYQFENEFHVDLHHDSPGIVSMANAGVRGGRGTNGSQIFITYVPTPFLDGIDSDGTVKNCSTPGVSCHSVFGKVIEGMEIVEGITPRDPASASTGGDVIRKVTIQEVGQ